MKMNREWPNRVILYGYGAIYGIPYRANAVLHAFLISNTYATKIGPWLAKIDCHHSYTQPSATDIQIAYYFQMGSAAYKDLTTLLYQTSGNTTLW
jgi:hypothetical protein